MNVTDIETALSAGDDRTIETAFGALVSFPRGERIEGARNVDQLCRLLERVTRALQHDQGAMPSATSQTIAAVIGEPISGDATYTAGAKAVLDHQYRWRGLYLQYAANGGTIG